MSEYRAIFLDDLKLLCEIFRWHHEDCWRCGLVRWLFGPSRRVGWYCSVGREACASVEQHLASWRGDR